MVEILCSSIMAIEPHEAGGFVALVSCIWLSVWAIRKRADIDYRLDGLARSIRWLIVAVGFACALISSGPRFAYLRVAGLWIGLVFLCWPNVAYYAARLMKNR